MIWLFGRQKRTSPDGGFFSRHDAMRDYLNSIYGKEIIIVMNFDDTVFYRHIAGYLIHIIKYHVL